MAADRAIAATSMAIRSLLQDAGQAALLPPAIGFEVAGAADLQRPLSSGVGARVWVYLHAVTVDAGGSGPAAVPALSLH